MTSTTKEKSIARGHRHKRIRAKVAGTAERPRLAVYRSNSRLTAQLINDETGTTIASVSSSAVPGKTPRERAEAAGAAIAKAAKDNKVEKAVFDRGGFRYMGSIKAFADAARGAGLEF